MQASFLTGGTWAGAVDPKILQVVVESPLGSSATLRLMGLGLIVGVLWRAPAGHIFGLLGACLASGSIALRGHALSEPQMILGPLVILHIICLAFWVGAFAPLARAARSEPAARAGALAKEFGARALWAVGLLVSAGGITLALLGAATPSALSSPYGQMFAVKIVVFAGLLALAAVNKLALTPALLASTPCAGARLRRSIGIEAALATVILVTTATVTTVTSPPGNVAREQAFFHAPAVTAAHQTVGDVS